MPSKISEIMTPDPVCCLAEDMLPRVAQMLRDEDVGSLPVISDPVRKGLIGIVTDRDIVVRAVTNGRDVNNTRVEEVMSSETVTCHPDDSIDKVMEMMGRYQIRRIPVVNNDNQVVGIVAQADVAVRTEMPGKTAAVVEKISKSS